jgi:hypothetical protein
VGFAVETFSLISYLIFPSFSYQIINGDMKSLRVCFPIVASSSKTVLLWGKVQEKNSRWSFRWRQKQKEKEKRKRANGFPSLPSAFFSSSFSRRFFFWEHITFLQCFIFLSLLVCLSSRPELCFPNIFFLFF